MQTTQLITVFPAWATAPQGQGLRTARSIQGTEIFPTQLFLSHSPASLPAPTHFGRGPLFAWHKQFPKQLLPLGVPCTLKADPEHLSLSNSQPLTVVLYASPYLVPPPPTLCPCPSGVTARVLPQGPTALLPEVSVQ